MSLIKAQGAGEVSTGFYSHLLDQSLKFNDADSPYLHRTPASQGSLTTFTFSFWYKRCVFGTYQEVLHVYPGSGERSQILFMTDDVLKVELEAGNTNHFLTNMKFRDPSAWYHVVVAFDSTNGTQANRVKIYVNGVDQSDTANGGGGFSTANYPSQNATSGFNTTSQHEISTYDGSDYHLDGYLAEVNFIDGTALTADSFGETVQGIWTPKDTSGLTFGTNGFHLTFKDDVVSEGFNTVTYTANAGTQSISGLGFEQDGLVWIKDRNNATDHGLFDAVRGAGKSLKSNTNAAEQTQSDSLTSFDSDGFSLGDNTEAGPDVNYNNGDSHVAWCWEAGGTPTADNSAGAGATPTAGSVKIDGSNLGSALAGSIAATRLSANTTTGFSIISYTRTSSGSDTIAHGLSAKPKVVLYKSRSSGAWYFTHELVDGSYDSLNLNTTDVNANVSGASAPTSSVFSNTIFGSAENFIAYCWSEVSGYSKFGSYTGNGSASGPSVTLGFTPAWIMLKRTDGGSEDWNIHDNTRSPANPITDRLFADLTTAETTSSGYAIDFNSNGFQLKGTDGGSNASGATYIYMAFADTREAAFFKDVSGQGNHWTPVNLDYRDSVPDTPTNNFAIFNALNLPAAAVLSEGNTKFTQTSNDRAAIGNMAMSSGKWYYEVYYTAGTNPEAGLARVKDSFANSGATGSSDKFLYITNATSFRTPAWTSTDATGVSAQTSETILGFAIDADNGKAFISVNGTYINSGNPAAGSNPQATFDADWVTQTGGGVVPFIGVYTGTSGDVRINFGQDSSFSGAKSTANSNADGNGHGSFQYAPPTGFLALCSQNLPDVDIIDGTENFNTVLWTGNGASSRAISGVGFSPDWVWAKQRSQAISHVLYDSVRGAGSDKELVSNSTNAEGAGNQDQYGYLSSFDSDGFTGADGTSSPNYYFNENSQTFVAWNWLAGTSFSNDASATGVGTIDSSGQVNTTAGFSIISWTGIGSAGTVAHGLGATPTAIIIKNRDQGDKWIVYHQGQNASPATGYLSLNETSAFGASTSVFNNTAPTSTVFTVNTGGSVNASSENYIAYCFTDIEGYSKHGSYVGNGNANGAFVYTGFRPAWIIIKATDSTQSWWMHDNKRDVDNVVEHNLAANLSNAEDDDYPVIDFLSNGFKCRSTDTSHNGNGNVIVFLAFADQPFKFANAR